MKALPLATVERWEPVAAKRGVSPVARGPRGFLRSFKRNGGRVPADWAAKREAFIKRHMAQVTMRREPLWEADGSPTRRHLALIMWAYSPVAARPREVPRENPLHPRHSAPHRDKADVPVLHSGAPGGVRHRRSHDQKLRYVGCVVNPKTMRPYFVGCFGAGVDMFELFVPTTSAGDVEVVGRPMLEDREDSEYAEPALATGFPRIHTSWGVAERRTGLGTALYTAGALAGSYATAMYEADEADEIPGAGGYGCSSGRGASDSAQLWWQNAVRYGLATEEEGEEEEEETSDTERIDVATDVYIDLYRWLTNPYPGSFFEQEKAENLGEEIAEHAPFEYVDNYDVIREDMEELTVRAVATVDMRYTDAEGEEHEDQSTVALAVVVDEPDFDLEGALDDMLSEEDVQADVLASMSISDDAEDVSMSVSRIRSVETSDGAEEARVTVNMVVDVDGTRREASTNYVYTLENAVAKKLVLDVAPVIAREGPLGIEPDPKDILDVVLNLDLGEVEDPKAMQFFFELAQAGGATHKEYRAFVNSVLAYRSDLPASLADEEGLFVEDRAPWYDELQRGGVRVNPAGQDFEAVGRALYGDLVDLEED